MKVILFGATGMIGRGVLDACLRDPGVERVLSIARGEIGVTHDKLREILHKDISDLSPLAAELSGYDACFFCLGVSAVGMKEDAYRRITKDLTLAVAGVLLKESPGMTFIYVSGAGSDSTEKGGAMWARVKGETENALLALPFKAVYMFRPAYIQPGPGVVSKTALYRVLYALTGPLVPVGKALFPKFVTTSAHVGRAMIRAAREGADKRVLENSDVNALAAPPVGAA